MLIQSKGILHNQKHRNIWPMNKIMEREKLITNDDSAKKKKLPVCCLATFAR